MRILILTLFLMSVAYSQPQIEPGVSQELARWRAARYSDVRYKLNLTIEKMSPGLKGTMEIRVNVREAGIVLDWRKIKGHEEKSTISNVSINGRTSNAFEESNEHLIFRDGVVTGENVIKLDFTSPILPSGSAITRYIDKEDGSEYIYSLFVPSDASTAFPVFDQPDLKARFELSIKAPYAWAAVTNTDFVKHIGLQDGTSTSDNDFIKSIETEHNGNTLTTFGVTEPISTYVFAFAVGDFQVISESDFSKVLTKFRTGRTKFRTRFARDVDPKASASVVQIYSVNEGVQIYVRKSQLAKFQPHAAEVFRLNREGIKFLEEYFDYKFPFPKYDLVLIPEFPFGGMEHAGATFLRESAVIFPSEPTANDHISRANLIFHEAAHQWFGDTVTMKWFDDLWLKEGFAEFMAYKTLERVMPQYNAWKAFYERNKPLAYATDSTRGTTPIYQEIKNLNSAKSAYGNIVYRKAPSFLKQAEFYLGPDKFQAAVRAFLKKHEYANAEWTDLVKEFEGASGQKHQDWSQRWVKQRGVAIIRSTVSGTGGCVTQHPSHDGFTWGSKILTAMDYGYDDQRLDLDELSLPPALQTEIAKTPLERIQGKGSPCICFERSHGPNLRFFFPNYRDYGYGIFLLDDKSRDYILKNIQNEKDDFLRSMMWGALWDSVREGELDPKEYVELAIKNIGVEKDELTIQTILGRASTAMTYYRSEPGAVATGSPRGVGTTKGNPVATAQGSDLRSRLESVLIESMRAAPTLGLRITYYRAFLNIASTENARSVLKNMLGTTGGNPTGREGVSPPATKNTLPTGRVSASTDPIPLKTKDRFDIVTKLASLGDPDAEALLKALETKETSDDAKRYAYAARAAFPTKATKEKYWNDFINGKDISESWIEAAFGPFNSVRHADLTLPYLERALKELPNHKRNRKIFFVNGWLAAFIGGQKSEEALAIVNKFLADNPNLDRDLRLKILENVDVIERAVKIRGKFATR